ncbi:MAG: hypothetical protein HC815_24925 [Richelia sp. RM1_1_1]|nr:hypothetical protein [Richelia sp. RM1_1_1]
MNNYKIFSDLEINDINQLESALQSLFINIDTVAGRRAIFRNTGIDNYFIGNLDFNLGINELTTILVAKFKDYSVSRRNPNHPLIQLADYIINQPQQKYNLDDEDIKIFTKISSLGHKKLEAFTTNTTEPKTELRNMPGIPPQLLKQLRNVLLECEQFESDRKLRTIFTNEPLRPWRSSLPQADSLNSRVDYLIAFLVNKHRSDTKENSLVLFVRLLSEQIDEADERHQKLADLALELEKVIFSSIEAFKTNPPQRETESFIPPEDKINRKLTSQQREELKNALISAFPSKSKLKMLLSYQLDKNLDAIAMGDNLEEIVFNLIETASAEGWLDKLIKGARKSNPGNQDLFLFEQEYYRDTPNDNVDTYKTDTYKTTIDLFIPPEDELEYQIEEEPWYAPNFPETEETAEEEYNSIKSEIDVVLITATNTELKAVANLLQPYPEKQKILLVYSGPETYYIGQFGSWKTVVTKCRMSSIGEGSVILATEQAQRLWNPRAIVMVGIAFGKDPEKQRIADVLVASQIISYEQQRVGEEKIVYRGSIPPSNTTLLNRFENVQNWQFICPDGSKSNIHIGSILSGEKLVDDPIFKAKLFEQFPQAIGGEMEGAGLCAASGRVGTAWILVKSICDWGDGKKHKKHQPLAAAAAASLVHYILSQKTVLNAVKKPSKD